MNLETGFILAFNKPYRWTSFNLVAKIRGELSRHFGVKKVKVGHAGTLDPLATGVMLVCVGKATKQIEALQAGTKEYIAEIKLGATTPSFDMETCEDAQFPTEHITKETVEEKLTHFIGEIQQIPPTYSAVKVDGKRAFKYARTGTEVELKPKTLVIDEIELINYGFVLPKEHSDTTPDAQERIKYQHNNLSDKYLQLTIRVICSKGTYIRALARDIGRALGTGAYLTGLTRTRIGDYRLADCMDVDHFREWLNQQPKEEITEQVH